MADCVSDSATFGSTDFGLAFSEGGIAEFFGIV
jgi:hypothetical protein